MNLNPDAVILGQLQGQWQKMLSLVVWKLAREKGVTITIADIQQYAAALERGEAYLLTYGHFDSIEFRMVTEAEARRIAAHDQAQRGRA